MAMRLLVIDGQGGGVGSRLVASLREKELPNVEVICVGTNVLATNAMLKAGADAGATGKTPWFTMPRGADCDLGRSACCWPTRCWAKSRPKWRAPSRKAAHRSY